MSIHRESLERLVKSIEGKEFSTEELSYYRDHLVELLKNIDFLEYEEPENTDFLKEPRYVGNHLRPILEGYSGFFGRKSPVGVEYDTYAVCLKEITPKDYILIVATQHEGKDFISMSAANISHSNREMRVETSFIGQFNNMRGQVVFLPSKSIIELDEFNRDMTEICIGYALLSAYQSSKPNEKVIRIF